MLCVTNDGRKIGLDQRLMQPGCPDDPNSKVNICVQNVFDISKLYCCKCVCGSTAFNWCKNHIDETGKIIYTIKKHRRGAAMESEKTISFISDRKHYDIPISDILYVFMKKQDAYVHISDGSILKTRMTFAEFEEILGDDFIRIHRGCLVSAMAIHSVGRLITLSNGDSLEYSAQHRVLR